MRFRQLILQNVFWRGLYLFSVLALNILISRYFKADGSGWIFYVVNNLSFLLLFFSLSLESGTSFYVAKREVDPAKTATLCLVWSVTAASAVGLFLVWFKPRSTAGEFISNQSFVVASTGYALGVLLVTYFSSLFFARQNFFLPNVMPLAINSLLIATMILFAHFPAVRRHFVYIYFASFLLTGLMLAAAYFVSSPFKSRFFGLPSFAQLRKIFRYSGIALFANLVFFLVYRVDYWFVKIYCSGHDLGNYIQVSKLGQLILLLPNVLSNNIFPAAASGQKPMIRQFIKVLTRNLLLVFLIFSLALGLAGHWLFPAVFGSTFNHMDQPFLLLVPGILALVVQALLSAYFAGRNKMQVNIRGSLMALVVIVGGDTFFIPRFGIQAAALVSSAGYIIIVSYSLFRFSNEFRDESAWDFIVPRRADLSWLKNTAGFKFFRRSKKARK
jgi:O-antigen/teichoic acid export membrane protein